MHPSWRCPCWNSAVPAGRLRCSSKMPQGQMCNALTDAFRRGTQWKPFSSLDQRGELVIEPPFVFELLRERPREPDMQISEVPPDAVVTRLPKLRYHERVGVAERPAAWSHRKGEPVAGGVHHTARPPAPRPTRLREACATPPPPPEHRVCVCVCVGYVVMWAPFRFAEQPIERCNSNSFQQPSVPTYFELYDILWDL